MEIDEAKNICDVITKYVPEDAQPVRILLNRLDEVDEAVEGAIALLREGMESTGTGTLHYRKMQEAIELLAFADPLVPVDLNLNTIEPEARHQRSILQRLWRP